MFSQDLKCENGSVKLIIVAQSVFMKSFGEVYHACCQIIPTAKSLQLQVDSLKRIFTLYVHSGAVRAGALFQEAGWASHMAGCAYFA
jgi:hypothetical protein